jgi:serine/threonine-protein kinase
MDEPKQSRQRDADPELNLAWQPLVRELGGKYELRRILGKGGMGLVILALHRELEQLVAIKLLHAELANSEFLPRFKREARAAIRIRSPHVARVMDVGDLASGVPFIVMEYLEGSDLCQLVATQGALQPSVAVEFMLQALDAMSEAHAARIVHRDIKPANLFLTKDRAGNDFVKVLDFGLAKSLPGLGSSGLRGITEPGTLVGSPCYMPPEQLLDAQSVDPRSDVWSLGATLFELVTGQPPFQAPTMPQLYTAIAHGKIRRATDLAPQCPHGIDAVIARCLTRNPAGRYANAQALREALLQAAREASPGAESDTLKSVAPDAPLPSDTLSTSVAPVASSFSPEKRLAVFVRPSVHYRRVLTALVVVVAGGLVVASARRASVPAAKPSVGVRSASAPSTSSSAQPLNEPASAPPKPDTMGLASASPEVQPLSPARNGSAKAPHGKGATPRERPAESEAPAPAPSSSIYDKYP